LKRKYTDAVNTSSSKNPPAVGSSSTSLCRLYHEVCPYFDWHPFANKDTKTPFLQSEKGKAYVEGYSKLYRMLDYKGMGTVTLLPNCPANFKNAPAPAPARSTGKEPNSHQYGSKKGITFDKDLVAYTSHLHTHFNAIVTIPSELVIATISLFLQGQRRDNSDKVTELIVETLLDSGSLFPQVHCLC
jgi:hypothetical protein